MDVEFRLKTGFFETKKLALRICRGKLILLPAEGEGQAIVIPEQEIRAIRLTNERFFEVEIQTQDNTYQGIVHNQAESEMLLQALKEKIKKRIICEYEGGN